MEYTNWVAEFVVGTQYERVPAGALQAAKDAIMDSVGVALAGSPDDAGRISAELAREEGAREEAAVFGHGFRSSASLAAFANGVSTHALDYDASFVILGQPMAGLTPTVFALAEALGRGGRQLLEGYVAGFEVAAKVGFCFPAHSSASSWHATGAIGSVGCAAAAARLLGLDVDQTRIALGIVSSMASGVVWNFGTMTKPLHAGLAARNGVVAAKLAQKGFTGNASMLDGARGFLESFAPEIAGEPKPLAELGGTFDLEHGVRYKAYPCGGLTHSAIDAALALRREHNLSADAIEAIDVTVTPYTGSRIIYRVPETGLQGKFSMPYILARAVLDGRLTPDSFSDAAIREPAALALLERVHMEVDPTLADGADGRRPARVRVQLKDGHSLLHQVDYPKGTPASPFSAEEREEKFRTCAGRVLGESALAEAMDMLRNLEKVDDVASLGKLLMGKR